MKKIYIVICLCFIIVLVIYCKNIYFKTTEINDAHIVFSKLHHQFPVSIEVYDEVWGKIDIAKSDIVIELSKLLEEVNAVEVDEIDGLLDQRNINGVLKYEDGSTKKFEINKYIKIDNHFYGDDQSFFSISRIRQRLVDELHTLDNLSYLIEYSNKITINRKLNEYKLSEDSRMTLSKEILNLKKIETNQMLIVADKEKGELLSQILIHSSILHEHPNIFILVYENNIVQVYDNGSGTGIVMYLHGELESVIEDILKEYK